MLLLAMIGLTVYVATQKSDFDIKKTTIINVPRSLVFNYMNDYKNWEDWGAWKEDDPNMTFVYPYNTVGINASYSWTSVNGNGKMVTNFVKQNDSIAQKITDSGNEYNSYLTFKDTTGGTKVSWRSKGSVDFMTKVNATFSGGVNKLMGTLFERSLNNLNKVITKEINTFSIKMKGIVKQPGGFYIKQTISCKNNEVLSRLHLHLPIIINFFKQNNMNMNGKPFVIYETINNDSTRISVCGPLREEIFLSAESNVSVGFLEPFSALKTTLTGDYSHRNEARKKAVAYFNQQKLERDPLKKEMEVYSKTAIDVKNPSKWETDFLIPVKTITAIPVPATTVGTATVRTTVTPLPTTAATITPKAPTATTTTNKVSVGNKPAATKPTTVPNKTNETTVPTPTPTKPKPTVKKPVTTKPAAAPATSPTE